MNRLSNLRGFTLIEVLIAMLIASIAVIGLVGMQAMAVASTQGARVRTLVTLQANSMAASMQGNTAFWTAGIAPDSFTLMGTVITDASGRLNTSRNCVFTAISIPPCSPAEVAGFDVQKWAASMSRMVPGFASTLHCAGSATTPFSCVLNIGWDEHYATRGTQAEADSAATAGRRTYTLYIAP